MFGKRTLLVTLMALIFTATSLTIVYAPGGAGPSIGTPTITPVAPGAYDTVTVHVNVTSVRSTIKNVTITYTTDNWKSVNRTILATYNGTTGLATAQIPPLNSGGVVAYYIVSYDNVGNKAVNNNNGAYFSYLVTVPPSPLSTLTYFLVLVAILAGIAIVALMILKQPMGHTKQAPPSREPEYYNR